MIKGTCLNLTLLKCHIYINIKGIKSTEKSEIPIYNTLGLGEGLD